LMCAYRATTKQSQPSQNICRRFEVSATSSSPIPNDAQVILPVESAKIELPMASRLGQIRPMLLPFAGFLDGDIPTSGLRQGTPLTRARLLQSSLPPQAL